MMSFKRESDGYCLYQNADVPVRLSVAAARHPTKMVDKMGRGAMEYQGKLSKVDGMPPLFPRSPRW